VSGEAYEEPNDEMRRRLATESAGTACERTVTNGEGAGFPEHEP